MNILSFLADRLTGDALLPNLLGAAALAVAVLGTTWGLRWLLRGCGGQLAAWTGSHRVGAVGKEATRRAERLLLRLAVGALLLITAAASLYQLAGRDVRADVRGWLAELTTQDLLCASGRLGGLVLLVGAARAAVRAARRTLPRLEGVAAAWLTRPGNEADLRRWFDLLEGLAIGGLVLAAAWAAARVLALPDAACWAIGLAARLTLILGTVRLLPLAAGVLACTAADLGDRHLTGGRRYRYWERVRRLFPFGLRCFEAAVYLYGASLCVGQLEFIAFVAGYGTRLVVCIGIFFGCRVVIELSHVLLNEAFGLYDERGAVDQKGQTLVPLLQSLCQYVLYFGSVVVMLGVLGIPTGPVLAGAGLCGVAVGLGAQSLVADVVSGFFILFEEQYLVGDCVRIGEAVGRVEAVAIRHTQVRDGQGRLHIIPNGQIKGVVNSSKDYINAVVDLRVPADADLEAVLDAMREAGRRLRRGCGHQVLADTEVQGLVDLGLSDMTVRAVTRVYPGTHEAMQNEYRRLLKKVLDEKEMFSRGRRAA